MHNPPAHSQPVSPRWRTVNVTRTELVGRILGHCPLYQRLGFVPPSLRRPR